MNKTFSELNIWAFQHVGHEDLGSFETILGEIGADIRYICGRRENLKNLDPTEPDILIVLGGPMGLYETEKYPYLLDEVELVKKRIESGQPILGICLGSQIIAKALGASVYKGPKGQEIGWHEVSVNHEGMKTPLKYLDKSVTNMMHWHGDTFDLPEGAVHLASSALYHNQAYSYKDHVFAVQCHPEITPRKLDIWLEKGRSDIAQVPDLTVEKLLLETEKNGQHLKAQARLFFTEWLKSVHKGAEHLLEKLETRQLVDA
jgi:GMP synthase (glutamine-hydrolysing)